MPLVEEASESSSMTASLERSCVSRDWRGREKKKYVEPGERENDDKSKLLIPLDTHMYRICSELDFTKRKQADIKTVVEITNFFKEISPQDPVKYDFALTRIGMHNKEKIKFKLPERSY